MTPLSVLRRFQDNHLIHRKYNFFRWSWIYNNKKRKVWNNVRVEPQSAIDEIYKFTFAFITTFRFSWQFCYVIHRRLAENIFPTWHFVNSNYILCPKKMLKTPFFSPQPTNLAEGYCYPPFNVSVRPSVNICDAIVCPRHFGMKPLS